MGAIVKRIDPQELPKPPIAIQMDHEEARQIAMDLDEQKENYGLRTASDVLLEMLGKYVTK